MLVLFLSFVCRLFVLLIFFLPPKTAHWNRSEMKEMEAKKKRKAGREALVNSLFVLFFLVVLAFFFRVAALFCVCSCWCRSMHPSLSFDFSGFLFL